MKPTLLSVLALILVTAVGATPSLSGGSILLSGKSIDADHAVVRDAARAVFEQTTITADTIRFDRESNSLRCNGSVTIRTGTAVATTQRATIKLGKKPVQVLFLDPSKIKIDDRIGTPAPDVPTAPLGTKW